MALLTRLLCSFSWLENRHHPWRNLAAVVAVMLGVALAFAVHLINASALNEFSSAVRSVNGQPDLELHSSNGQLDEALYTRVAQHPNVALASPVLEVQTYALDTLGVRKPLRIVGVDALVVAGVAPALMPVPNTQTVGDVRFAVFSPTAAFLNSAANALLPGVQRMTILRGMGTLPLDVAGSVAATGSALAVMDIGAVQDIFGLQGRLSRIDLRLAPGTYPAAVLQSLELPSVVMAQKPGDATERVSNLSRAYRVNMTVLALVALFTGAFLVFSVLSLSVAKRAQQFALLGVLGLTARERLRLVLAEAAILGLLGSAAGIALATTLAAIALKLLGGDLGGGYFSGVTPPLQWNGWAALAYAALGTAAALVGAWWPARAAADLPLAQTLKGLGAAATRGRSFLFALFLVAVGVLLTLAPPVYDIPVAAYLSVGLLLVGGIGLLPWLVALAYDRIAPWVAHRALPVLAVERARRMRETAAVAVSGVVAALSLAVALTVMVASFRSSVMQWLDVALPAPLYVRAAGSAAAAQVMNFPPDLVQQIRQVPGVERVEGLRIQNLQLASSQPSVALIARWIDDPAKTFPLVSGPASAAPSVPPDAVALYVSEAMVDLYQARLGYEFPLMLTRTSTPDQAKAPVNTAKAASFSIANSNPLKASASYYVAGVWRDYARQFGAIAIDQRSYARITGDLRVNDLAIWLQAGVASSTVKQAVRSVIMAHVEQPENGSPMDVNQLIEFASADEIRAVSLTIFDRSFAVTYWLQAVAIAIGLFGVAASFSAQVLARRKEFGLLTHLGLTRKQILSVVAAEGTAWTAIGSIAGCVLGLVVAAVLVHVVNPQSFHWTMDMHIPWLRLAALCVAVVVAGTVTAWLAGRAAAGQDAVMAVKEDW